MDNLNLQKINIVCSGGEMKGGFVAGFLRALVSEINLDKFEITFYCVSASVPTVLFYMTHGEKSPDKEIWIDKLSKEGECIYNGFLRIDMGGILRVFRDGMLDKEKILNHKDTIIFPIYNIEKRKNILVSNKKGLGQMWMGDYDVYELVHAAIAAPVLYGKSVKLGEGYYCDPGLDTHIIFPKNKNKTIFITQNKNIAHSKFMFLFIVVYSFFSETLPYFWMSLFVFGQRKVYRKIKNLVKSGVAISFEPVHKLIGNFDMALTKKDLEHNYNVGIKTFEKNKEKIVNFLSF
jgi:predicted patatin/cPLA2 family phospholipase